MLDLKRKIVRINSYSILAIVFVFAILNFITVYLVLNDTYDKEKAFTKQEYIDSQKMIIKNQINNFINFIDHTHKIVRKQELEYLEKNIKALGEVLSVANPNRFQNIFNAYALANKILVVGLSDESGKLIFTTAKDYSGELRKRISKKFNQIMEIHTKIGIKYAYLIKFTNKINHKTYILGNGLYESTIKQKTQQIVLDRINSIKFGAKNNGYISVAKILDYKGGKRFAKVLAIPIKPSWVGRYISDSKKDAKGKMYRKEYLKIINTKGEGYVSYWFYKKGTKELRPKLSYVKVYKPYDWLIFTGVYLDDIKAIVSKKEHITKAEIKKIFFIYLLFLIVFLLIAYIISKYENRVLKNLMDSYENVIVSKNEELKQININLEKEVKEKTEELLGNLLIDNLTNLPNREKLLIDIKDKSSNIALLNIDSFKEINDFYGIEMGDKVLKKLGFILSHSICKEIYKLAADEFAIVSDDLEHLKESIENFIFILSSTAIKIDDEKINVSVSCGIGHTFTQADMALKYAKKKKNENVVVFDKELNIVKDYENNLKWKNIIYSAIRDNKILPFVQPIIDNKTQKVAKYECLIRLENNGKIYSPFFFLEISKNTRQYHELQKIMISKTFEKFSKLNSKFSINLSTLDLTNYALKKFLLEKIEEFNIADKLIVELLEDEELLQDEIVQFLDILKSKNIQIAIDDFGSGYSNFSYLINKLPVSILKIDSSLVKNIAVDEKDFRLFKVIVDMAKKFDFEIVAEYVENKETFELVKQSGVDYTQGYYFSPPFDMRELEE